MSTFYGGDTAGFLPALRTFYAAIASGFPPTVTFGFPNSGDRIDDSTGTITSSWSISAVSNVVGSGTGTYAPAAGIGIRWNTDSIVAGRHLKGRTFFVPTMSSTFTSSGGIASASLTAFQSAADALLVTLAGAMFVWHRPGPSGAGTSGAVTTATVIPKQLVLRSRRD